MSNLNRALTVAITTTAVSMVIPPAPVIAQDETPQPLGAVIGHVFDARTGTPLAGAVVSLAGSDSGSLTNRDGGFLIPEIALGPHTVTLEHLGYKTLHMRVEATLPGAPLRVLMDPDPILLEGLEIVSDRFERRRRSVATRVTAFGPEDLLSSPYWSVSDLMASRALARVFPCEGRYSDTCVVDRGRRVEAMVYFDEMPLISGWTYLATFAPHDLYMVEVYRGGTHIRLYSHAFMKRAAANRLFPVPLLPARFLMEGPVGGW